VYNLPSIGLVIFLINILFVSYPAAPTLPTTPPPSPLEQPPRHRHRRTRTIYTPDQLASMESMFICDQYPDINSREALADAIGLSEARIQVGF